MKKVVLMFLLVYTGFSAFAQEYKKVSDMLVLRKPEDAKTELDKIMANPKTKDKAAGQYWLFAVYANMYGDSALATKYPGSDAKAFDALENYAQQDTSLKALKENTATVNDFAFLRATGFNHGVTGFNAKNWQAAYTGFSTTVKADKFMEQHHLAPFTGNFVDTNTYLYAGYAAQNATNLKAAAESYKYLADKGIVVPSNSFENSIYYTLLGYYVNSNDQDDFKKYADVVKKLLPQYAGKIDQMSMQNLTANTSLPDLLKKYKAEAGNNLTEAQYANYADAFSQPDKDEVAKLDSAAQVDVKLTAADAYAHAYYAGIANGVPTAPNNLVGIYAFDASVLYTNIYQTLADRFDALKGSDASLKAKRDQIEKLENQYADSAVVWATNTYNGYKSRTDLTKREMTYAKNASNTLYVIYGWKQERARGNNPKDYDKYEALAKQFDTETDRFDNMYKAAPKTN